MAYKNKVFFINSDSIFSKLITFYNYVKFGSSDATHVGIVAAEDKCNILVFESLAKGFTRSVYEKDWIEKQIKDGRVELKQTNKLIKNVKKTCEKYEGVKYGKINIIIHAINLFLTSFLKFKIKYSDGIVSMHCSEAVSRVLYDCSNKRINFEKEYGKPFDNVSPQEIYMSKFLK
jgi:hypothetical protein